jgi:hypothetical protein
LMSFFIEAAWVSACVMANRLRPQLGQAQW